MSLQSALLSHAVVLAAGVGVALLVTMGLADHGPAGNPAITAPAPIVAPASPTPAPLAKAAAHQRAVVTIVRPRASNPTPPGGKATSSPTGPSPSGDDEVITVELTQDAAAEAPVVVVTPAPVAAARPDTGGAFGLTAGVFPGMVALDYQVLAVTAPDMALLPGLRGMRLGASVILNHVQAGAGGNLSLPALHPRLYLTVGYSQTFQAAIDPKVFVGVGWRL